MQEYLQNNPRFFLNQVSDQAGHGSFLLCAVLLKRFVTLRLHPHREECIVLS